MEAPGGRPPKNSSDLGQTHLGGTPAQIRDVLARIAAAISSTAAEVRTYMNEHHEFADMGELMLAEWDKGVSLSLAIA